MLIKIFFLLIKVLITIFIVNLFSSFAFFQLYLIYLDIADDDTKKLKKKYIQICKNTKKQLLIQKYLLPHSIET